MDLVTGKSAQPSAFYVGLMLGMIWGVSRTLLFCQHLKPKAIAWILRSRFLEHLGRSSGVAELEMKLRDRLKRLVSTKNGHNDGT